ncbi:hypothetical protein HK405_012327, partial [Cladochytrium tenue]
MRNRRLSPASRAAVLRSCSLLLSSEVVPLRAFKCFLPQATVPVRGGGGGRADNGSSASASCLLPALTSADLGRLVPPTGSGATSSPGDGVGDNAWMDEYRKIDCEWSLRMMDRLYNAAFVDFVRTEKNCEFIGRNLAGIVKDYKLEQVVHGIKWLVQDWSIESTARLLKNVFDDWLPELAAFVVARVGAEWSVRPKMGLVVSYMVIEEPPKIIAIFIRSLTVGWEIDKITELICCLDTVLRWSDEEVVEASQKKEVAFEPSEMVTALGNMYKTSVAIANYKILLTDYRLTVAKCSYIAQFTHAVMCSDCIHRRPCNHPASGAAVQRGGYAAVSPSSVMAVSGRRFAERQAPAAAEGEAEAVARNGGAGGTRSHLTALFGGAIADEEELIEPVQRILDLLNGNRPSTSTLSTSYLSFESGSGGSEQQDPDYDDSDEGSDEDDALTSSDFFFDALDGYGGYGGASAGDLEESLGSIGNTNNGVGGMRESESGRRSASTAVASSSSSSSTARSIGAHRGTEPRRETSAAAASRERHPRRGRSSSSVASLSITIDEDGSGDSYADFGDVEAEID